MKFRGSFANLDGSKAAAQLHARMSDAGSWMVIRASRLGGSVPLSLEVRDAGGGNATVASFVANRRGQVSLRFRTVPRSARDLALGFDPRGKTLVISVASGDRLEIEVPGDDTPPPGGGGPPPGGTCTAVDTGDVFLVPQAGAGTAKARFRRDAGCKRDFRVEADDVPVGSYDLCSGGTALGSFDVVDNGVQIEGEIEFDDQPDQPDERPFPAGFSDPQGQPLEVHAAGATSCSGALLFSFASFPDDPGAPGGQPPATCTAVDTGDLFLVPAAGIGTAKARFRRQADCGRDFRVEVEDVAPGSFEVCVGGVSFGSFDVADNGLQIEGEIELDDQPDQPGERPFPAGLSDPLGQPLEVHAAAGTPCSGALLFSFASFPDNPGAPGGPPPATCTAVDTGDLLLARAAGVGKAKARFRRDADCGRDFRVEVEDVAPGSFEVCVGGVSFGSFDVADNGLQIEGEIELDDQPDQPGERPFPAALPDPVGERIEVRRSGATPCSGILFFSFASFPDNPGTP